MDDLFLNGPIPGILGVLKIVAGAVLSIWWLWLPALLLAMLWSAWVSFIRTRWAVKLDWVLLEINPPKNIERTPKIMEHIFSGFWTLYGNVDDFSDKYIEGAMQYYLSMEIEGSGDGGIHFYVRVPRVYRNLVEAQIYAQYPQAEIFEAEDYAKSITPEMLKDDWNMYGFTMRLSKPDAYPIRTYPNFADVQLDQPMIDPLASLMEALGKLNGRERVWIQTIIRPASDDWKKRGDELVASLMGKVKKEKPNIVLKGLMDMAKIIFSAFSELFFGPSESSPNKEKEKEFSMANLSPRARKVIEIIEESLSKKGFETTIRIIYFAHKDIFKKSNAAAISGIYNQFSSLDLNGLRPNGKDKTKAGFPFKRQRLTYKKRDMLKRYRYRLMRRDSFVLNIEELATVFHFPMIVVETPSAPKIEVKRGAPPTNLPIG